VHHGTLDISVNDQSAGPKIGQNVIYNAAGVNVPAIINQVNADGTVGLITFPVAGPAQQSSVHFSPLARGVGTWWYGDFF
jgi:hypothetical protein